MDGGNVRLYNISHVQWSRKTSQPADRDAISQKKKLKIPPGMWSEYFKRCVRARVQWHKINSIQTPVWGEIIWSRRVQPLTEEAKPEMLYCTMIFQPKHFSHGWAIKGDRGSKRARSPSLLKATPFLLPTCPEEAKRLMVVNNIHPRLVSSLWFTSRNWTIARLAASGNASVNRQITGRKVTAHCCTQMGC